MYELDLKFDYFELALLDFWWFLVGIDG